MQQAPRRGGHPLRVVVLNWRDLRHPDGGGSERYIETIARGLVERGHEVTVHCADHGRAPRDETVAGVRYRRRGGRATVYPLALLALLRRHDRPDVVVDVSNGVPFFSPLVRRGPVVGLVHHVHREQWPAVVGGVAARVGWFLESRVAPLVYRRRPMVAVSPTTRRELLELGYRADVQVVHNGTEGPAQAPGGVTEGTDRATTPVVAMLGRVVPHKRVDHALQVLARLREELPDLRLVVIGDGWGGDDARRCAADLGVLDAVEFTGFVDEATKHRLLASSWVHLCPSLKEGWGLAVMEAAWHGVPTVAYAGAGGLADSVVDGRTGVLAVDLDDLVARTRDLLLDTAGREAMAVEARRHARSFTWERAVDQMEALLLEVAGHGASRAVRAEPAVPTPGR